MSIVTAHDPNRRFAYVRIWLVSGLAGIGFITISKGLDWFGPPHPYRTVALGATFAVFLGLMGTRSERRAQARSQHR